MFQCIQKILLWFFVFKKHWEKNSSGCLKDVIKNSLSSASTGMGNRILLLSLIEAAFLNAAVISCVLSKYKCDPIFRFSLLFSGGKSYKLLIILTLYVAWLNYVMPNILFGSWHLRRFSKGRGGRERMNPNCFLLPFWLREQQVSRRSAAFNKEGMCWSWFQSLYRQNRKEKGGDWCEATLIRAD